MRLLVAALALLVTVAYAHHTSEHKLGYPKFVDQKTHLYDVTINVTSGVPGLHPQVSKSVMNMELKVYAKTPTELILSIHKVRVSDSLAGVGSNIDPIHMKPNKDLEEHLKVPIKAVFRYGKVESYTLDQNESLESAKIKRTILRNFEVYLDKSYLNERSQKYWPLTYNLTRSTPQGNYHSHYVITSSPYAAFPEELNVFNISRTDNYEVIPYLTYHSHHNFEQQGCPEVCRNDQPENRFGAGCPVNYEPYQTPLKRSFYQQHDLRTVKNGETIIDMIRTKETHVADLYDQNMEIAIRSVIKFVKTTTEKISESSGQQTHSDLDDWEQEINTEEINQLCKYPDPRQAVGTVKNILEQIAKIVEEGEVKNENAKMVGEQIILLQKAMVALKQGDFRTIQETIVSYDDLANASEQDRIKRQIWLDLLPVVGSDESVSYIVHLIQENMNKPNKAISLWESKTILEALPLNIIEPSEKTITELSRLLDLINDKETTGYNFYDSASYLAVARVIRELCTVTNGIPEEEESMEMSQDNNRRNIQRELMSRRRQNLEQISRKCPKTIVKKFIQDVADKLKSTNDKAKRVMYIQTLARTGLHQVLPILHPYIYGHFSTHSHSYTDYVRTVTLHAFHHLVGKLPREVQQYVLPVYFNKTEPAKLRNAAFSVIIRSQPSLGLLQEVAAQSWQEPSVEVGSYVSSTMDTFGNSTIPCHQLTALRIKKVLPQLKRVERGQQHSKNYFWNMFDDIRGFGMEKRFEYVPSNESFFPAVMYGALGYNVDSLRDIFYQYALTSQGLSSRNVWDPLLRALGVQPADDIPKEKEDNIFPELNLVERDTEFWRFAIYEKLFYSSSYYYFDEEDTSRSDMLDILKEQLSHYFKWDSQGNMKGHLVKVYIPSSYHTKSISHAMPSVVEFEMKNPLLLSLKLRLNPEKSNSAGVAYSAHIKPSVYYSTLYTHQYLNLGDCKDIGVYHEKRVAASYPIKIRLEVERSGKFNFSYSFPELPKTVFVYHSEAGTYAGKTTLTALPPMEDRKTYKTIPSQFKKHYSWGMIGLPQLTCDVLSEDIQLGYDQIPRNPEEALQLAAEHFLNAGWRRKSIVLRRVPDSAIWQPETEVTINMNYRHDYVLAQNQHSEEDWSKDLKFEDSLNEKDEKAYAAEGQKIDEILTRKVSHLLDVLKVQVDQSVKGRSKNTGNLNFIWKHTLDGSLHLVHFDGSASLPQMRDSPAVTADYAIAFHSRPNEFRYSTNSYGKQRGLAIGSVGFSKTTPFQDPSVAAKAVFSYEPLENYLGGKMQPTPPKEAFWPESHEECTQDVTEGKAQSIACVKATREHSIYNKLKAQAVWRKEMPELVQSAAHQLDFALKYTFYPHVTVHKRQHARMGIHMEATYIDQMTDEPVVDVVLTKPTEEIRFNRVSAGVFVPMSSIDSIYDTYTQQATNNTYPVTCSLMDKYVMTYDMKTYRMPRDAPACTYVLSTHCTEYKKFAVLVKINPERPGTQELHMYLGKDHIVLVPGSRAEYKLNYNGKEMSIRMSQPIMLNEEATIYAVTNKAADQTYSIEVHAHKAGIKIVYNGKNVKMQVSPMYKGELCGLCSEFNGEIVREFRGADRCLYSHSVDFVKAAMVGSCGDKKPTYPYICDDDQVSYSRGRNQAHEDNDNEEEGNEPSMKRNVVINRNDKLCFSTKPMPVCENNATPTETESQEVDYHCLPKQDRNARKMVTESRRRILGELETKSVDLTQQTQVAKMC